MTLTDIHARLLATAYADADIDIDDDRVYFDEELDWTAIHFQMTPTKDDKVAVIVEAKRSIGSIGLDMNGIAMTISTDSSYHSLEIEMHKSVVCPIDDLIDTLDELRQAITSSVTQLSNDYHRIDNQLVDARADFAEHARTYRIRKP